VGTPGAPLRTAIVLVNASVRNDGVGAVPGSMLSGSQNCGGKHVSMFPSSDTYHNYQSPGFNVIERHNGVANVGFADGHVKAMKHVTLYNNGSNAPYFNYSQ